MQIGIMTCGGDCPGLNAAIRAVVHRAISRGVSVLGFEDGFEGLLEDRWIALDRDRTAGILPRGGSILGSSGANPFVDGAATASALEVVDRHRLTGLIVIGGNNSMATALAAQDAGIPVVGVPKTIDNDVEGTDVTIGYDTAVATATEAIDRLTTTAESHDRVLIVETMGRDFGWIAVAAGIAGGADLVLPPEEPIRVDRVIDVVRAQRQRGKHFSIIVVGEGALFEGEKAQTGRPQVGGGRFQLGGVGSKLAEKLAEQAGAPWRITVSVIGHLQRGGSPSAADRILATRFGIRAADAAMDGPHGNMVAISEGHIVLRPLTEVAGRLKPVNPDLFEAARAVFEQP